MQAVQRGVKRIRVHTLTDGRDTEDGTSVKFMEQLQKDLKSLEGKGCDARVASGGGRMVTTMDRYEVRHCICVTFMRRIPSAPLFFASPTHHTTHPALHSARQGHVQMSHRQLVKAAVRGAR